MDHLIVRFTLEVDDLVDVQSFMQRPLLLLGRVIGLAAVLIGLILLVADANRWLGLAAIAYGLLDLTLVSLHPLQRLAVTRRGARIIGSQAL